ncbi:unnamed protein product, partial [Prorocentrum cordatum]
AAQRLRALLPALLAMLRGEPPTWLERLRRNVALHADASGIDVAAADAALLRQAQGGPRLEVRRDDVGRGAASFSADAAVFVPHGVGDMGGGGEELEYQFDAGSATVPSVWPGLWEVCESLPLVHDAFSDYVEKALSSTLEEAGSTGSASVCVLGVAPGAWEPLEGSLVGVGDAESVIADVVDEVTHLSDEQFPVPESQGFKFAASPCSVFCGLGEESTGAAVLLNDQAARSKLRVPPTVIIIEVTLLEVCLSDGGFRYGASFVLYVSFGFFLVVFVVLEGVPH